jgi:hypothetical protein
VGIIPEIRQPMHGAICVDEGEPTLGSDHQSAAAARSERRRDRSDVKPVQQSTGCVDRENVASEHVDEAQPGPIGRPDGAFPVKRDWLCELLDGNAHGQQLSSVVVRPIFAERGGPGQPFTVEEGDTTFRIYLGDRLPTEAIRTTTKTITRLRSASPYRHDATD